MRTDVGDGLVTLTELLACTGYSTDLSIPYYATNTGSPTPNYPLASINDGRTDILCGFETTISPFYGEVLLDFLLGVEIKAFYYYPQFGYHYPNTLKFSRSNDGTTWEDVRTFTGLSAGWSNAYREFAV